MTLTYGTNKGAVALPIAWEDHPFFTEKKLDWQTVDIHKLMLLRFNEVIRCIIPSHFSQFRFWEMAMNKYSCITNEWDLLDGNFTFRFIVGVSMSDLMNQMMPIESIEKLEFWDLYLITVMGWRVGPWTFSVQLKFVFLKTVHFKTRCLIVQFLLFK